MRKNRRLVCLIVALALVLVCTVCAAMFIGNNGFEWFHKNIPSVGSSSAGSTNNIVTDYDTCWILGVDGKCATGTVVSWMIVNENLIQVTLKNISFSSGGTVSGPRTYLVSVDRVYFLT